MSADTVTVSPTQRLGGVASAVDRSAPGARSGSGAAVRCASVRASRPCEYPTDRASHEPASIQRRPAAPHLAARRTARAGRLRASSTGWPTAGQSWWQMLPLGPPDRARLAVQVGVGVRRLAGAAGRARARPCPPRSDARVPRAQRVLDRGLDPLRRRGALADQVRFDREWAALRAYAARARRAADRRRADLRRPGLGRPRARTRSCSATARGRACRRTRSPTRASCGATRSTTGRRCSARGYRWWTERFRRTSTSSTSRGSTTSAASSPTGRCRADARYALRRALAARAGPGACSTPPRAALGDAAR